jgi:hypothetical protein
VPAVLAVDVVGRVARAAGRAQPQRADAAQAAAGEDAHRVLDVDALAAEAVAMSIACIRDRSPRWIRSP